jgi:hypothetical protein
MRTWAIRIAVGLGLALFTLVCILLAMRLAGPITRDSNFGTLQYEISPSFSGKAQIFIPLAGWEIEAPVFDAPYAFKVQPREVHPRAVRQIAKGVRPFLNEAKHDVRSGAIFAFVRTFLIGLAGGLVAGLIAFILFEALQRRRWEGLAAGGGCFALAIVLAAASGLWVWQSLDIEALKRPTVTQGIGAKAIDKTLQRLRNDESLGSVIRDLAPTVVKEVSRRLKTSEH